MSNRDLFVAIQEGEKEKAIALIEANHKLSSTRFRGTPPIITAVEKGDLEICQTLLRCGCQDGPLGLLEACKASMSELVKVFLALGIVPGEQHLIEVIRNGDQELVSHFISKGALVQEQVFIEAVKGKSFDICQSLLGVLQVSSERKSKFLSECLFQVSDPEILLLLIEHGADVNRTKDKVTLLYRAVSEDLVELVKVIIKAGANVNASSYDHSFPLHKAIGTGNVEMVNILLEAGADCEVNTFEDKTPLHYACARRDLQLIRPLIKYGAKVDVTTAWGQFTPLHLYLKPENFLCNTVDRDEDMQLGVKELLVAGAPINATSREGVPLHFACQSFPETVELLLEAGADIHQVDHEGRTPLHICCSNLFLPQCLMLVNSKASVTGSLHYLCRGPRPFYSHKTFDEDSASLFTLLLSKGADPNEMFKSTTPLHCACFSGNFMLAKMLVKENASVHSLTQNGSSRFLRCERRTKHEPLIFDVVSLSSPLLICASQPHWIYSSGSENRSPFVEELLSLGANPNEVNSRGDSPLSCACQSQINNTQIVRALLKAGANVHHLSTEKKTPLHKAAQFSREEICKLLIDFGALVQVEDIFGDTPLHAATVGERDGICQLLLEHGANLFALNHKGQDPSAYLRSRACGIVFEEWQLLGKNLKPAKIEERKEIGEEEKKG